MMMCKVVTVNDNQGFAECQRIVKPFWTRLDEAIREHEKHIKFVIPVVSHGSTTSVMIYYDDTPKTVKPTKICNCGCERG